MLVALPSRIALPEHREREPVDLEVDDPGNLAFGSPPPWRRAIRWTTRSVYVSSSFVPKITSRTTLTAATSERREQRPAEVVDHEGVVQHIATRA